ncbi:MAG TPA: hypothetical protein VFR18_26235 [Terriglobia bacterium]|nr:hypothetical protein [Terriglobia bacterium]
MNLMTLQRNKWRAPVLLGFFIVFVLGTGVVFQGQNLRTSPLNDPIALLTKQIERGEVKLDYTAGGWGYLPSLLNHLGINIDSQILVFSKTSLQHPKISPKAPRAIYFNDNVTVGYVQGGNVYEFTSLDPSQGLVFYTMDTQRSEAPRFERRTNECLICHAPAGGLLVSSVFPSADGTPLVTGTFFAGIDHRTPIEERWGGWYVSGTHGSTQHMGNAVAPDPDRPADLEQLGTQNLRSLSSKIDPSKYLTSTSDIVALMTIEHQTHMTNLITGLSRQFRQASNNGTLEKLKPSLDRAIDQMVDYMLFVDEAPLREPVQGVSSFTVTFPQRGPRDRYGRSLRDFDLQRRLFRYPLSYMIYTEIFDAIPEAARHRIYQRLFNVLSGMDGNPKFAHISDADRRAILEIVRDTKTDVPDYWSRSDGGD